MVKTVYRYVLRLYMGSMQDCCHIGKMQTVKMLVNSSAECLAFTTLAVSAIEKYLQFLVVTQSSG